MAAPDHAGLGTPGAHHYLSAVAEANDMIDIVRGIVDAGLPALLANIQTVLG
ncbi:hypothetical protein [Nocardia harenae]|uniref:hypothetical protein n=1 Tax=Nocardia harenae TaxID=358707 RepID=UPI000AECFF1E|nr:hypothetical protein [Nocardia harenae]